MSFFRIEMLPARHGDCLWIEYGEAAEVHRILIDGGPVTTFAAIAARLEQVPMDRRVFDLVVLTHVDADHVEGLVRLFAGRPLPFVVRQVWFNGWRQMRPQHGLLGPVQGEFLSALLARRAPDAWPPDGPPWVVPDEGPLPAVDLPGGMTLTLLSPSPATLEEMAAAWAPVVTRAGIPPGNLDAAWAALARKTRFLPREGLLGVAPDLDALLRAQFVEDDAPANGSSIALLAECGDKRALLLADAFPGVVAGSLARLCAARGAERLEVDAVKVSHHGSRFNTDDALLRLVRSPAYLISTNGEQFHHPDAECLARIVARGEPERLYFNYRSEHTAPWLSEAAQAEHGYVARVREADEPLLRVEL
jgi:hypothetical protein